MPLVKFIAPTDPRWLSTLDAMSAELVSDSLVYRYNVEASPDGLEGDEGTFSICSFFTVKVSMPMAVTGHRTPADVELVLSVWLNVSVRVWKELWPDTDAMVIAEQEPARRALPG